MQVEEPVLKRPFDIFFSLLGIIISLPLWGVIAIAIKLDDRGPVFYLQSRIGKKEGIFKIRKFRTMIKDAENNTGNNPPFFKA